ncbi:MAG: hypothetical protein KKE61_23825, partial [Proteobacteria bacterium]|nr:hypothetical protein [Pseudomonadota bacterium]
MIDHFFNGEQLKANEENPWLGLVPYTEADQIFFFGRSLETLELYRMIKRKPLTVFFGASGIGKTSLLCAGLFPLLRKDHYLPINIRLDFKGHSSPSKQVKQALTNAISENHIEIEIFCEPIKSESAESLWEYLHRIELWDKRNQLITPILIFDQFEEIFTIGKTSNEISTFLSEISDLIENHIPQSVIRYLNSSSKKLGFPYQQQLYKVLFALRDDFVVNLDSLRSQMPSVMHNRFSLNRMNGRQALKAISGPGGHFIENKVAEEIVLFVSATKGEKKDRQKIPLYKMEVEPSLLSVVCRELNLRRQEKGENLITLQLLSGGRKEIISDFYEHSLADLGSEIRELIEDELLTESGYRDSIAIEDALVKYDIQEETLSILENRRLLRREERLQVPRIELVHDLLTSVVLTSRENRRRKVRMEKEQLEVLRKRKKLIIAFSVLICILMIVSGLGMFSFIKYKEAKKQTIEANHNYGLALFSKAEKAIKEKDFNSARIFSLNALKFFKPKDYDSLYKAKNLVINNPVYPIIFRTPFKKYHSKAVTDIAFSSDGKMMASASYDNSIILWDTKTMNVITVIAKEMEKKKKSKDKKDLALEPDEEIQKGHSNVVTSLAFSPDNKCLASASVDKTVILWDLKTFQAKKVFKKHTDAVFSVVFSPDGKTLASASADQTIIFWDMSIRYFKGSIRAHSNVVYNLAFSSDGKIMASASADKTIILWDMDNYKILRKLIGHKDEIYKVAFSPDNKTIASASFDKTVILWDVETGKAINNFSGHSEAVYSVAFSPDGKTIAF